MRLTAIMLLLATGEIMAQGNFSSTGNGNWSAAGTWLLLSGTDADGIPDADDNATVLTGHNIKINNGTNSDCNNLTLNGTATIDVSQAGRTLIVNGTLTMNGNSTLVGGVAGVRLISLLGDFLIPAGQIGNIDNVDLLQSSARDFRILGELISTNDQGTRAVGNVYINSGLTSTGKWTFIDDATWFVQSLTITGGPVGQALIDGTRTGTINVAGNLSVLAGGGGEKAKFGDLNLTVTGTTNVAGWLIFTSSANGDKRFNNTITVTSAGTWDNEVGEDPFINASIVNNGSWPAATGGSAIYTVENTGSFTYTGTLNINMHRLVVNQSTVTNLTQLTLIGDPDQGLQVGATGTFINGNGAYLTVLATAAVVSLLAVGGTVNVATPSNTVDYAASFTQSVYSTTYHKLIASNSGTKAQGGTVTVNSELDVTGSAIYSTGTNILSGAANLVMTGTAELQLGRTGVNLPELTGTSNSLASGTTINLTGNAAQTLKANTTYAYQNVSVSGAAGSAVNLSNVTNILGNVSVTNAGAITTIAAGGLTVAGTYNSNSSGTTTMTAGNLTVGSIVLAGSGTFSYAARTITINGNSGSWTNNGIGTLTSTAGTVVFTTGTGQTLGGTTATTFNNLTINNSNGVTLSTVNPTVSGTLNLVAGPLITGTNKIIAPTVTRTSGLVQGTLQKPVATGTNVTILYELGTGTTYAPVTLVFATVTVSGTGFAVGDTAGDHPQIISANMEPSLTVNRYWTITRVGNVTFTVLSATLNFAASDVDGGFAPATDAAIKGYLSTTDTWKSAPIGVRAATSTEFLNVPSSNFGDGIPVDFQIGKRIIVTGFFNRLTGTSLDWHSASTWINNRDGNITLTNGSANVTGTGTAFNLQLVAGDQIVLQTNPSATPLTVLSITSGTAMVLTAPYSGTTTTGSYGRLKVPNTNADSVVVGNPQFSVLGTDAATTILLTANATVHTLAINEPPNGRTTPQILTHNGTSQLTALQVSVNQPTGNTTDAWNINAGAAVLSGDLTIGSANGTNTRIATVVLTTGTLTIGGDLFFRSSGNGSQVTSVLNVGSGRVNLAGSLQSIGGRATLTMGATGVFNFNSTTITQLLDLPDNYSDAFIFSNIECNNTSAGGVQLLRNLTATNLTGNFRVLSGRFYLPNSGNPTLTGAATKTFEVANGAFFEMLGNGSQGFPTGFTTYTLGNTSTVTFSQTGNVTLPSLVASYGHLTFTGTSNFTLRNAATAVNGDLTVGTGSNTPTVVGGASTTAVTVTGNVSIGTGAVFNATDIPTLTLNGNWTNNGTFTPGTGLNAVVFGGAGAAQPQTIGGTTADVFYRMTLNTNDDTDLVTLSKDISVSNLLTLTRGGLSINGNQLSVTNPAGTAIARTSPGYIKSETTATPYSRLRWTLNTATGTFVYPFGKTSAAADYIPYTLAVTGAGATTGTFEVSTYGTGTNNLPYPSGVTDLNGGGDNNGSQVVDRFWIMTRAGFTSTPTANITFTCTATEAAGIAGSLRAQRWTLGNVWEAAIPGQTNPTATSVTVPSVTSLSPWTLVNNLTPLPITLLHFTARPVNGTVELDWETATEINNDFFEVERSKEGEEWKTLGKIPGAGNSHVNHKYNFIDTYPLSGLAYYRLRQTDYNGKFTYSNVVRVETDASFTIMAWPNPSGGNELNISWRDGEVGDLVGVRLLTVTGVRVFEGEVVLDEERSSRMIFENTLSSGLYILEAAAVKGVQRIRVIVK